MLFFVFDLAFGQETRHRFCLHRALTSIRTKIEMRRKLAVSLLVALLSFIVLPMVYAEEGAVYTDAQQYSPYILHQFHYHSSTAHTSKTAT